MDLQLFGEIETESGRAEVTLCRDADLESQSMLHWWLPNGSGGALLCRVGRANPETVTLAPERLFAQLVNATDRRA